jgi:translocation protein SEC63
VTPFLTCWPPAACVQGELLLLAQLTGQAGSVPAALQADFASCLAAAPRLLEELMKMALVARPPLGRGWLRPAQGVMEVSQGLVQAIPLSARKAAEKAPAVAELLQLPHCSEQLAKRLGRKRVRSLQDLLDLDDAERAELLQGGGLTPEQAADVEAVLGVVPQLELDATAETEGEEGVQEGDVLTLRAWVTLTRREAPPHTLPHTPLFPYPHEEGWWLILADGNDTLVSQKVTWADEEGAVAAAKKGVEEAAEQLAAPEGAGEDMRRVEDKIRGGARLVTAKFLAPAEGIHLFTCYCLSDTWLGVDAKCSIKLKVSKRSRAGTRGAAEAAGWGEERGDDDGEEREEGEDEEEEDELEDEDYESEYSSEEEEEEEEEERAGKKGQVRKKGQDTEDDSKSTITEIDGEAGKALVKIK